MKKYLISLLSAFYISFSSSMVVSCFTSTPDGSKINVDWYSDNDKSLPEKGIIDSYISTSLVLPVFNMLNSTDESRKQATSKNDGMTDNQVESSLSKVKDSLIKADSNWNNFYQDWESNKNYFYSKIYISPIDNSELTTTKSYDNSSSKTTDNIITTINIKNTINYLDANANNVEDFNNHPFVYINLSNDSKINKWNLPILKLNFNFDGTKFNFNVDISNLVAEASLVKIKDKYEWFLTGYNFASEEYYPSINYDDSGNYFQFLPSEISDKKDNYIFNDLIYIIEPQSIKIED